MNTTSILTPTYGRQETKQTRRFGMMEIVLIIGGVILGLLLLGWLGLQVRLAPFPAFSQSSGPAETMPLPANLPPPVARFYGKVYGGDVPVIKSAVISGRAQVRPVGPVYLPARFRFTHEAGVGYRHYIEAGLFGLPLLQVDERYLDGHAVGKTPFGVDQGDKVDQAANLGMWAERIWMPAMLLSEPGVEWQAIDDNTAGLVVPFNEGVDHYIVRFNPETGLIDWFESMRFKNQASPARILWLNKAVEWAPLNDFLTNTAGSAIWMDDGTPWATFYVEDIRFNVDVHEYIRSTGP